MPRKRLGLPPAPDTTAPIEPPLITSPSTEELWALTQRALAAATQQRALDRLQAPRGVLREGRIGNQTAFSGPATPATASPRTPPQPTARAAPPACRGRLLERHAAKSRPFFPVKVTERTQHASGRPCPW